MKTLPLDMIRSSLNCILLLLTCFFVSSGKPGQESAQLRVRVLFDNSPVVGAMVSLSGSGISRNAPSEYQQYTDDAGECEFTQLSAGIYSFSVSKLSFFSTSEGNATESELVLSAGQTKIVQSNLTKGGVVTGRLLNADSEALTGIPVTALWVDSTNPQRYHLPPRSESNITSLSDDRGIFRIYGLRPGTYVIAVNAQRDASLRKDILPLRYLGGADLKNSAGVFIGFSEEIKLPDIQLTANFGEASSLSGTVEGKGNLPLAEAVVSLLSIDDQTLSDKVRTNATGGFTFEGLVPGRYRITASSKQGTYRSSMKDVDLSRAQTRNLVINLSEYPAIEGRTYLFRNEKPEPLPMLNIALMPVDGGDGIDFASGSDGRFAAITTRTGSFSWNLPTLAKNQYLAYIALGNKDITSSPLSMGDKSISDIAIYVSTGAAGIEGHFPESIQSGCKNLGVYAVLLSTKDNTVLRWKSASTCNGNSFAIYSLPPGKYYLVALPWTKPENANSPRFQDDALRAALKASKLDRGDVFTLDRNQTASRQPAVLQPIAGARQ